MDSLTKNQTWALVLNPENKKIISYKWILKKNKGIPSVEDSRFKTRIMVRGFTQEE